GLARAADDVKLTMTGYVSGTPLYMAPEQALGEEADPRSDLFSLGAILYEMCAGQPPFDGNSALAILRQTAEVKQRPLRELNPQVPEWLAQTIDRLLAKKPADRIQTADHLAELLEFQWALMKTSSEDVPTVCKVAAARRTRRNRWIAGVIGTTFLTLGLVGGRFLSNSTGLPAAPESTAAPLAVLTANAGAVWSVAFDDRTSTLAMAIEDGTVRLWDMPTTSIRSALNAHRGTVWFSRFSPQGDFLATAGDDGLIKLWKAPWAEPVKTFEHSNAVRGLAISGDGRLLYAGDRAGGLRVWSLEAAQPLVEAQQPGAVYAVAISPDGQTLATAGSDKVVRLWNAQSLSLKLPLEGHSGPIYGLTFYPGGRRLASVGWDKTMRIWDAASGVLLKSWEGHAGDIWSVAISPDGKQLVTGGTDSAVKLWDAETGELLNNYLGHKNGVHTVAFNHDGTQIASGGRDGVVRIWKVDK
ncbi:MAG TPA: serine/threonine-protein kinase, partial [Pirellulales bacterium]|nr:serine/threonine-protein kinase [Pirellulales bacterium]